MHITGMCRYYSSLAPATEKKQRPAAFPHSQSPAELSSESTAKKPAWCAAQRGRASCTHSNGFGHPVCRRRKEPAVPNLRITARAVGPAIVVFPRRISICVFV